MILLKAIAFAACMTLAASAFGGEEYAVKGFTHMVKIDASGCAGSEAIAFEFFPGIKVTTEPAVTGAGGQVVASKVLLNMKSGKLMMLFDGSDGSRAYMLHYGGKGTFQRPQKKWDPTPSVLLEIRTKPAGAVDTYAAMQSLLRQTADKVQGMMFVPSIWMGHNPFGPNEEFISIFRAELSIPEDTEYRLFTASCDASFVVIDDKPEFSWPGMHGVRGGRYGERGANILLTKGRHKVEYYHAYSGRKPNREPPCMMLGWRKKGEKDVRVVPASAFVQTPVASVGKPVRVDGSPAAHFTWFYDNVLYMDVDGAPDTLQYTRYKFGNNSMGKHDSLQWEFGDGVTSTKPQEWHVFADPPPYKVRLTIKSGNKTDTCEIEVPFLTPTQNATIEEVNVVRSFAETINTYQFEKMQPLTLLRLFELIDTLEQPLMLESMADVMRKRSYGGPVALRLKRLVAKAYSVNEANKSKAATLLRELADSSDKDAALEARVDLVELYLHQYRDWDKAMEMAKVYVATSESKSTLSLVSRVKTGDVYLLQAGQEKDPAKVKDLLKKAEDVYRQAQAISSSGLNANEQAMLQGGYAETVSFLLNGGRLRAAREKLIEWEAQFPLSKITGDFILLSSQYWEAIGDSRKTLNDCECLLKINPLTPHLPSVEYRMANAYRSLGNKEKARALYEKVIREYPKSPVVGDAMAGLNSVR